MTPGNTLKRPPKRLRVQKADPSYSYGHYASSWYALIGADRKGLVLLKFLSWGQDSGGELGIAFADHAQGDCDALVEALAGEAVGIDDMAQFVLWVALGGGRDSFI